MDKKILLFLIISFISLASSQSFHQVEADRDKIDVNSTIRLECISECPVNNWQFSYILPQNSSIRRIEDSFGQITNYSKDGKKLFLRTNSGPKRTNETVKIDYTIERPAEEIASGLFTRQVSFSGFENKTSSGVIEVDELLSGRVSHGFQTYYNDTLKFEGLGPVNIHFNFGNGVSGQYYEYFNGSVDVEESYRIALGTVGLQQSYDKIPVIFHGRKWDGGYEWSSGEYGSGVIHLRQDDPQRLKEVLVHETVHALSDRPLSWDRTETSYMEEGVAKHAESLMSKKLYREGEKDSKPAELFGDNVTYSKEGFRYTVSPRGNREELWRYYENENNTMKEWNPRNKRRGFGYAYSELIIKNYLINSGNVSDLYSAYNLDYTVESTERKWNLFSEEVNMEPCNHPSREEFDRCLDRINQYNFKLIVGEPSINSSNLKIEEIDMPERLVQKSFIQVLVDWVREVKRFWRSF